MKTCLLIPVKNRAKILPIFLQTIDKLNPQPDKIFFFENNSTDNTLNILAEYCQAKPTQTKLTRLWFKEDTNSHDPYVSVTHARQILLTEARNYNPDYAIFLDTDIIVKNLNLITQLTQWQEHIVAGYISKNYKFYGESTGAAPLEPTVKKGALFECDTASFGCICLSKKIIQNRQLSFYPSLGFRKRHGVFFAETCGFCQKARWKNYKVYQDTQAIVNHIDDGKSRPWRTTVEECTNRQKSVKEKKIKLTIKDRFTLLYFMENEDLSDFELYNHVRFEEYERPHYNIQYSTRADGSELFKWDKSVANTKKTILIWENVYAQIAEALNKLHKENRLKPELKRLYEIFVEGKRTDKMANNKSTFFIFPKTNRT